MSSRFPAALADPALHAPRRRRGLSSRIGSRSTPYLLVLPATAVIGAVLGYPLYYMVKLSLQHYGLFQLVKHKGEWVGTRNYAQIFHDGVFWHVVFRTLGFTVAAVSLTMVLGTLIALLLAELGPKMRLLLTAGLIFVWATPVVVAVDIWRWMVDYEFGVLNWLLTFLHVGNYNHHDWFVNPWTGWAVITALVVWGAIPFVAITVFAGLTQVPKELIEAASARLDAEDLPIVGMLFARVRVGDIARTLGVEPREIRARALRIIGEMQASDRRHRHAAV